MKSKLKKTPLTVTVLMRWISHYRKDFYEGLKVSLGEKGIDLRLLYGEPVTPGDLAKNDWVQVPWGTKIRNSGFGPEKGLFMWQDALGKLGHSDLLIVEQANRLLINYVLMARRYLFPSNGKLAFWGHGRNFQNPEMDAWSERFRNVMKRRADWWFAYTELSRSAIRKCGFPEDRITLVENAIDTRGLAEMARAVTAEEVSEFKKSHGIQSENIAVFCSGMYREKRLEFLIESALTIRTQIKDFELVIIGGGAEQIVAEEASRTHSWIHYLGPTFGKTRVVALKSAKVYLLPSAVGLGVLDSFALLMPIVAAEGPFHGPEIAYIKNGINGRITENSTKAYADSVIQILSDSDLHQKLVEGAHESLKHYTLQNMVKNFSEGVLKCLKVRETEWP